MNKTLDRLVQSIQAYSGPPIRLMEVCGTHTHQLSRFGIPSLLPSNLSLLSGPGCPVCVTPAGYIDRAAAFALTPGATLLSFGDMLRVPGHTSSLLEAKAAGGSVALMYSPMDAIAHALREPSRIFYVAAVGFETTIPLYALLLQEIKRQGIRNIRLLTALKALLPGLHWLCGHNPEINGFIGPGHVSTILGYEAYAPLCEQSMLPLTVAGFAYEHLIAAIFDLTQQICRGTHQVHNLYPEAVTAKGNPEALALIRSCFVQEASVWRGLGNIPSSGYRLSPAFAEFDAGTYDETDTHSDGCLCGSIITGKASPADCACFGISCTPERPLGPCMVSGEGACGIWHATARTR